MSSSRACAQVRIAAKRSKTAAALKEQVERDYVLLEFVDTRGGTELGFQLDRSACVMTDADFDLGKGTVHLVGSLVLDSVPVTMVADLDLSSLEGTGHLEVVGELKAS
ncbi:MAG TPA: hypothetical protein VFN67_12220 [Polyangiales bacterium]|nr:hypothetical protein [Polyangiales bacterium]